MLCRRSPFLSVTASLPVSPRVEHRQHFKSGQEHRWLSRLGVPQNGLLIVRENHGYNTFDDFLMTLKQSKRKNIRQERKHVAAAGLSVERLRGADLKTEHWDSFYEFYRNTTGASPPTPPSFMCCVMDCTFFGGNHWWGVFNEEASEILCNTACF